MRFGSEVPPSKSRSVLVVSHHLDGFLRSEVAGLLHPAADLGFAAFPDLRTSPQPAETGVLPGCTGHSPQRYDPSKNLCDSRAASPQPLPPRRSLLPVRTGLPRLRCQSRPRPVPNDRSADLEALLHRRVPGARSTVAGGAAPCSFLGFLPLQGPSARRCSTTGSRGPPRPIPRDRPLRTSSAPLRPKADGDSRLRDQRRSLMPPESGARTSYIGPLHPRVERWTDTVGIPLEVRRSRGLHLAVSAPGVCPEPKSTVVAHR